MNFTFDLKSGSKKDEQKSSPAKKPVHAPVSIFNLDEEDDEMDAMIHIPKGAKMSKNIGRDTPTAVGPKSFGKSAKLGFAGTVHNWSFDAKQHPLHRPVEKYFSDKQEQQKKQQEEELKEKKKKESIEELKLSELQKIKELIKAEKMKVKICLLCKRKFANSSHLNRHEKHSEMHRNNGKGLKV